MSSNSTPSPSPSTSTSTSNEVRIWVACDEDANRVSAVLEALGYTVLRELGEGDGPGRLTWAVQRLASRHKLTVREQDILERVLAGRNNEQIGGDLEISRATVKWHMHNIFAKTNTSNRESLLRLALQLGGGRTPQMGKDSKPSEDSKPSKVSEATTETDAPAPSLREALVATEPHKAANHNPELIPAAAVPSKAWF